MNRIGSLGESAGRSWGEGMLLTRAVTLESQLFRNLLQVKLLVG